MSAQERTRPLELALLLSLILYLLGGRALAACPFTLEVRQALDRAAALTGIDPRLLYAQAWVESRFCTDAVSPKGAIGLLQVTPPTARGLGLKDPSLLYCPDVNAEYGARYLLRQYRRWRDWRRRYRAPYSAFTSGQ